jgi:putative transposase
MPGRKTPLVKEEIYHVYNRGIDRVPTFVKIRELKRALTTLSYYQYDSPPMRLSYFLAKPVEHQVHLQQEVLQNSQKIVDIIAFCLMPNHYHFLLRQISENGISEFISKFQNSYTRYFNQLNKRDGSLFLNLFKAERIETDEQLIHVSRYIHLNPLTSYVVKDFESLKEYNWSSLPEYLELGKVNISNQQLVTSFFKTHKYEDFLKDQVEYQRQLHTIKHLLFE